jgi:hypothetical protein
MLESQKNPAMFAWFDRTKTYYSSSADMGDYQNPLVFSYNGKEGETCGFMQQYQMSMLEARDYSKPEFLATAAEPAKYACAASNPNLIGGFSGEFTDQASPASSGCGTYKLAVKVESELCDLDPAFLRAVIAVDGSLGSPDAFAGKAEKLCDAWSKLKSYAIALNINTISFEADSLAKQKVAFFASYAYRLETQGTAPLTAVAKAESALSSWNGLVAGSPPLPGTSMRRW